MGSSAFFVLFFITCNWFLVFDRTWEISLFCFLLGFSYFFGEQFYLSLSFSSLAFLFSLKSSKTNPKRTTEAVPVKVLKVSLTFGHLKCLNSGLCLVALSGYSDELSQIWPALQAAQELQGRISRGPVEWRCRQIHRGQRSAIFVCSHQ